MIFIIKTAMTYIISEASCDVKSFLFFFSSIGILSSIKLNLRIACQNIINKFIYVQTPDLWLLMLLHQEDIKTISNLFLDQDIDSGVYYQMTNRIQEGLCDFVCSCKKTCCDFMLCLQRLAHFLYPEIHHESIKVRFFEARPVGEMLIIFHLNLLLQTFSLYKQNSAETMIRAHDLIVPLHKRGSGIKM